VAKKIQSHRDLQVYQKAFSATNELFSLTKSFPKEETYSLTDQVRRSSRSVCANLAEAWRKRRYDMKGRLSANYLMLKAKPPKRKFGSRLPSNAAIWIGSERSHFTAPTKTSCGHWSA
jgi:hypothetical protein